jgi:hypothetical protein
LQQLWLVEADDRLTIDCNNWYALLSRRLDHLHRRLPVSSDVFLDKLYPLPRKKLFRLIAVWSGGSGVDNYSHRFSPFFGCLMA